jgi:hypothetical protein
MIEMYIAECAICGKAVTRSLVCRKCKATYDLSEPWAKSLQEHERKWRNALDRDANHNLVTFSDYRIVNEEGEFDGWDVLDGEIEGKSGDAFLNAMGVNDEYFVTPDEVINSILEYELYSLADEADWTQGELNAMFIYLFAAPGNGPFTSKHAAEHLSTLEGKTVTPDAYRRRLSDARKKVTSNPTLQQRLGNLLLSLRHDREQLANSG